MKAELENGEIITLEKDCDCITHEGPHWVHLDRIYKEKNQIILSRGGRYSVEAFCQEECARLDEKERQMKQRGILRIYGDIL